MQNILINCHLIKNKYYICHVLIIKNKQHEKERHYQISRIFYFSINHCGKNAILNL